jgi:uncharacterized protein YbjT (DUF2867 family)
MTKALIIGAYGQIARVATQFFLDSTDVELTLYLRNARRLKTLESNPRITLVEGDATDQSALERAMAGQDVVYANLSGDMGAQSKAIVAAMAKMGVKRLIFVSSMGIYDEVPGEKYGAVLHPYRESVKEIEASDLDYTVIRPAWLNDRDEVAYGITRKGEPFANPDAYISRKSVADLIVMLATKPDLESRQSLGVHKADGTPF